MKKKRTFINSRHTLERTDIGNLPNRREMLIEDLGLQEHRKNNEMVKLEIHRLHFSQTLFKKKILRQLRQKLQYPISCSVYNEKLFTTTILRTGNVIGGWGRGGKKKKRTGNVKEP